MIKRTVRTHLSR